MLPSCFHLLRCPNEGIIRIETDLAALFGFRRKPVYNPQNRHCKTRAGCCKAHPSLMRFMELIL